MTAAMPLAEPVIVGVGARSPSGLTALQVTMSARAHVFTPRGSHMIDRNGDEIATGRLCSIADHLYGLERFAALGGPALTQAAFPWISLAQQRGGTRPIPVFIALPTERRSASDINLRTKLLRALEDRAQVPIDHDHSSLVLRCRGGGVAALEMAIDELHRANTEVVLVGGVDSYFDPDVLEHLDAERRLHSPEAENGFIPGEGAAFLLLARRKNAGPLYRYGQIVQTAVTQEPRSWGSPEPSLALGMTLALKRVTAPLGANARRVPWVLTDVANERHRVDEWMYAFQRSFDAFTPDVVHDQPLLKMGDVGAASAAMLLVIAAVGWQTGSAVGDACVAAVHSDGPDRGAVLVSAERAR